MPPPIIQIGPANQTLPLHSDVTLHCKATNPEGENPVIRWLRDGEQLTQENLPKRYTLNPDGTLLIDGKPLVLIVCFIDIIWTNLQHLVPVWFVFSCNRISVEVWLIEHLLVCMSLLLVVPKFYLILRTLLPQILYNFQYTLI